MESLLINLTKTVHELPNLYNTDSMGSKEHNLQLSEKRAKAVVDYLINNGIDKDRLSYKGMGSTASASDNATTKGRQLNRRVEFRLID